MSEDKEKLLEQNKKRQRGAWITIGKIEFVIGSIFVFTMVMFPPLIKYSSSGGAYPKRLGFWGGESSIKLIFVPEQYSKDFIDMGLIAFGILFFAVICLAVNAVIWMIFDAANDHLSYERPLPDPDREVPWVPEEQDEGKHA